MFNVFSILGFNYDKLIDNKSFTCEFHPFNQLFSNRTVDLKECEEKCNNNDECYFMFHTEADWCSLYKICNRAEVTEEAGSTFRKLEFESGKIMRTILVTFEVHMQ